MFLFLSKPKKRVKTLKSANLKIFWDIISLNVPRQFMRNNIPEDFQITGNYTKYLFSQNEIKIFFL